MLAKFIEWAKQEGYDATYRFVAGPNVYVWDSPATQTAWDIWTAADVTKEAGDGWALVPVEHDERLITAMAVAHENSSAHDLIGPMEDAYNTLIAAAPQPQNHSEDVREDHPPTRHCMCKDCAPSFEPAANPLGDVRGLAACVTCGQPVEQPEAVEPVSVSEAFAKWQRKEGWKRPDDPGEREAFIAGAAFAATLSPTASQALRMGADVLRNMIKPGDAADERSRVASMALHLGASKIEKLIPPTESDQRKLGFAEGVKVCADFAASSGFISVDGTAYKRMLDLTPSADTGATRQSLSEDNKVTMTRDEADRLIANDRRYQFLKCGTPNWDIDISDIYGKPLNQAERFACLMSRNWEATTARWACEFFTDYGRTADEDDLDAAIDSAIVAQFMQKEKP